MVSMKFMLKAFKSSVLDFILLFSSGIWVVLNVYFLPFHIWDAGVMRPWYMLHGYLPYRDFTWIRMPFDLFLLSWWYRVVGVFPLSYQSFYIVLMLLIILTLFIVGRYLLGRNSRIPFLFFIIFLFPLFQNTEVGELLIGLFSIVLLGVFALFIRTKKIVFLLLLGCIAGLSFITKQNSVLVIAVVYGFLLYKGIITKEKIKTVTIWLVAFSSGLLVPILLLIGYFYVQSGLSDFLYYTVYFLVTKYTSAPVTKGDGGWILISYMLALIPLVYILKKMKKDKEIVIFLIFQTLCLFSSLLPSFLSYRAFTAFPLMSLVFGYIWIEKSKNKAIFIFILIGFIALNVRYISPYLASIQDTGFRPGQYLTSYGESEREIGEWIRANTKSDEKIINYGSEMIYLFADRLPKNKYVEPFPYLLQPFEKSTKVFTDNPPRVVIYDKSLPNDHMGLSDWPFLRYLQENYNIVNTYSDNLVIYQLSPDTLH